MFSWRLGWFWGTYDPLRSIVTVFYDLENADSADFETNVVTFNHEYSHLIGTLGRHLQIHLLHRYVSLGDTSEAVIQNERSVIESFVPVWLTPRRGWLTPSADPKTVAPDCEPTTVYKVSQACHDLEACGWIMNGKHVKFSLEQILREIQQAILNTAAPGASYSLSASRTSLKCLSELAKTLAGKTVEMQRAYKGEYFTDASRVLDVPPAEFDSDANLQECDMLELFLANTVARECGLELKRYTLHERAELVLTWVYKMLCQNYSAEKAAEVLAGIGSVFMPGVLLPFVACWRESMGCYRGEVHALPFGFRTLAMPKLTRHKDGQTECHYRTPLKILQLLQWPSNIRQQCPCELGAAMSDFCEFALGDVVFKPFRHRSSRVFSRLGDSVQRIASSLQRSKCGICSDMRARIGEQSCDALSREASRFIAGAGDHYAAWLSRNAEEQFKIDQRDIPGGVASVSVDPDGSSFFRYV